MFILILFIIVILFIFNKDKIFPKKTNRNSYQPGAQPTRHQPQNLYTPEQRYLNNKKQLPNFVVIDTETTGLDPNIDKIIEIGCVRVRNHQIKERLSLLINPEMDIPEEATAVNGITNEMISDSPIFDDVANQIWNFIGDDTIVGYNINFDKSFLFNEFGEELRNPTLDVCNMARKLVFADDYKLTTLADKFHLGIQLHRATSDAEITFLLFEKLITIASEQNLNITISQPKQNHNRKIRHRNYKPSDFKTPQNINSNSPVFKKHFVITGNVTGYRRKQLYKMIVENGGTFGCNITKRTNYLVVGFDPGESKLNKAKEAIEIGQDIKIIYPDKFFDLFVKKQKEAL